MGVFHSSRAHYLALRESYKKRRLDDLADASSGTPASSLPQLVGGRRRE